MTGAPELSRVVPLDRIGEGGRVETIVASAGERAALAERFGLEGLDDLRAEVTLAVAAGGYRLSGRVTAAGSQACVVSGEPVSFRLDEPIALAFSDAAPAGDEVELDDDDLDVLPLDGNAIDVGEAVAQSFGLALDPYPRAPAEVRAAIVPFIISEEQAEADATARKAAASPFAALRRPR